MGEFKDFMDNFDSFETISDENNKNGASVTKKFVAPSEEELVQNPFAEEFDRNDVINPADEKWRSMILKQFMKKGIFSKESELKLKLDLVKDIDIDILIDSILNYSDEKRRERQFNITEDFREDEDIPDEKRLAKFFKDYMVAPKISGTLSGLADSHFIPSEKTINRGDKIEISDDPIYKDPNRKTSTVLINRNEESDIESIEVLCNCGERTLINFDIVETEGEEQIIEINRHQHNTSEIQDNNKFDVK